MVDVFVRIDSPRFPNHGTMGVRIVSPVVASSRMKIFRPLSKIHFLLIAAVVCFLASSVFFLTFFMDIVRSRGSVPYEKQAELTFVIDERRFVLRPDLRRKLGEFARRMKNFVYREATTHNPPGDVLPDDWDDRARGVLREQF